ncbi:MAG: hypothetical protein QOG77_1172 [Solirubrobacteraceae bacterium]|jgi:hypothetical protein|nr:hypothetical protein [Solirubrobacteraceae bacterium]
MSKRADAPRPRRGAVYALLVAATITAFLAVLAVWVQRQVLDGDNWTKSSTELLDDPAIRTAVSGFLVDQLYANVDVTGQLRAALPEQAKGLAGPAAGGLRNVAGNVADEALQRPRVQALWENANGAAHARLMKVLDGGGEALATTGGVVSLDLGALLAQVDARTGIGGRAAGKLPPGAANIVILRSDNLKLAQNVANALRPLAIILTTLAIVLFGLAIWLARGWRREALRAAGLGFVVAGIGALLVRRVAGTQIVDALAPTAAVQPAAEAAWRIETSLLVNVASAAIAYGVVAVLGAWLAGPTGLAVAARRTLAPYLRDPAPAYGAFAALVLLLLVWAPTQALRQPVTALVLIGLLAAGFEVLRRQAAREFPDADRRIGAGVRAAFGRLTRSNGRRHDGDLAAPAVTPAVAADPLERLERVAALHDRGALTDAEFTAEKDAILAAS